MYSRTESCVLLALSGLVVATGSAWADYTNNILITGYWPQTNNMVRQFSTNPAQNPSWQGGNWEGRGYNIHSYFPEFPDGEISPGQWGKGEGDFEVDYQDTHADWVRIVDEIKPAAIITFSRGGSGSNWELEGRLRMWSPTQWINDYEGARRPTADMAIFDDMAPGFYDSALPLEAISQAVLDEGAISNVFTDTLGGGRFLSEFIGMHGLWYHQMNSGEDAAFRSFAAGHIHVGINTPLEAAERSTEATLRALTDYLDTVVPTPGTVGVFVAAGVLAGRRRR